MDAEKQRLKSIKEHGLRWKKWGPFLSERQWGTVREDYSATGDAWPYFPHDAARSRVYRWGEDGIAGLSDDNQIMCFAPAFWNGKDPILKERLFGLSNPQGNHGEDVKELYYYLWNTPTHSYMEYLYQYPQEAFPYDDLLRVNKERDKQQDEYEILDTGVFDDNKYFDINVTYAKSDEEDLFIKINITNRGQKTAPLSLLPTIWFRNLWSFGIQPSIPYFKLLETDGTYGALHCFHVRLGDYYLYFENADNVLFTDNETNTERLFNVPNRTPYVKDAFHEAVISGDLSLVTSRKDGTKCAPLYEMSVHPGKTETVFLRLTQHKLEKHPFEGTDKVFAARKQEAEDFYRSLIPNCKDEEELLIFRQAISGLLWSKQYYHYDVDHWLRGDKDQPPPPIQRKNGRNCDWRFLNNADILIMPDKWEYPWYAAWDLAFHCTTMAIADVELAKEQLILLTREWYMAPNGQLPAYEWNFSDVNPPVHAWAALQVYEQEKQQTGKGDIIFLKKIFQKLLINFTWWVNRKDVNGNNVFEGGFLGLDNIGLFNRSQPLENGEQLEQADATSWMAMYALNMMGMAIEISTKDKAFEDVATKFFEHFAFISSAINNIGAGRGLWDEEDGFFYDMLKLPSGKQVPLKVRSLVGLTSLFAVSVFKKEDLRDIPGFHKQMRWFINYSKNINNYMLIEENEGPHLLLSLMHKDQLRQVLHTMLAENEFLSPGGIRSLSKAYSNTFNARINGHQFSIDYEPAESRSGMFGGNSNWRGPVWMPMNYLIIQSLKDYHRYCEDEIAVEYPTGSGNELKLDKVAESLSKRLVSIFKADEAGNRPVHNQHPFYRQPENKELILFYEYFHGDNARGVGASHQTGWTSLVANLIQELNSKKA